MPRGCGCAGGSCGCLVVNGQGVTVSGTGNASDPYMVGLTETAVLTLGPYTAPGAHVELTGIADANAIIAIEYEVDFTFTFSTVAPIGTRLEMRLQPSFGSTFDFIGNVLSEVGWVNPVPAPVGGGNIWVRAVKMNSLDWYIQIINVEY